MMCLNVFYLISAQAMGFNDRGGGGGFRGGGGRGGGDRGRGGRGGGGFDRGGRGKVVIGFYDHDVRFM